MILILTLESKFEEGDTQPGQENGTQDATEDATDNGRRRVWGVGRTAGGCSTTGNYRVSKRVDNPIGSRAVVCRDLGLGRTCSKPGGGRVENMTS